MTTKFKLEIEGELSDLSDLLTKLSSLLMASTKQAVSTAVQEIELPAFVPRHVSEQQVPVRVEHPATMEPLTVDPVYGGVQTAYGPHAGTGESNPDPGYREDMNLPRGFDFSKLKPNPKAWTEFVATVKLWLEGFDCPLDKDGNPTELQPDRLTALKKLGEGRWPLHILRYCAVYGSLQGAVFKAYEAINWPKGPPGTGWATEKDIDLVWRLAANMTQVAHAAFPDLVGFYDHSTKWKRELQKERGA